MTEPVPTGALLDLVGVSVSYRRHGRAPVNAVLDASLHVDAGEIVGLVGESGCGKSTLGRAAVGLQPLSTGEVRFDGVPVAPLTRRARPRHLRALQMMFQDPYASLNPRRRVGAQIVDAAGLGRGEAVPRSERFAVVEAALARVGLGGEIARRYPHEFSGGQCQRIAIARVLASGPRCLVADEPISALDASAQAQVANLLALIAAESGVGMLFISHDLSVVRKIAHRTAVMYLGRIVESGTTESLWRSPAHPYTEALIAAVPEPGSGAHLPVELVGDVPDPARPPAGCRFHPRCPAKFDRCSHEEPTIVDLGAGREARCFLAAERLSAALGDPSVV